MTHTKQFIEDAIEGGWIYEEGVTFSNEVVLQDIHRIFLDSTFWQAVGKARGWKWECPICEDREEAELSICSAHRYTKAESKWHTFIDHLADGLSYDEALSKLV